MHRASRFRRLFLVLVAISVVVPAAEAEFDLEPVAGGFVQPTALVSAGDGSGRLFVAEQAGRIWVVDDGVVSAAPFLDISDRVKSGGGDGLLGLAFARDYETSGLFFVHYVNLGGRSTVSRFRVSANDPDRARAGSEAVAYAFPEAAGNHKGGDLAFGRDGHLYLAMGDGSAGGDPEDNAQNLASRQGKILRFDVATLPAVAPSDNPFVDDPSALAEIWAYGLRNPWRMSFDRDTGDLFIADVGQEELEEVDVVPAASGGGQNFGWRLMEGSLCFEPATGCDDGSLTAPILEYAHDLGCSITGGYVYRGASAETVEGAYVFGDFCSGTIWAAAPNRRGVWVSRVLADSGLSIVTFGEDDEGELYVVDYAQGAVFRLVSRELFVSGFESGRLTGWRERGRVEVVEPGLGGSGFALAALARPGRRAAVEHRLRSPQGGLETAFALDLSALEGGEEVDVAVWSGAAGQQMRLAARRVSAKRFRLTLMVTDATRAERRVGSFRTAAAKPLRLRVDWRGSSGTGAADGSVRLERNGRRRGTVRRLTTAGPDLDRFEVGLPGGAPADASGWLVVDEVVLAR